MKRNILKLCILITIILLLTVKFIFVNKGSYSTTVGNVNPSSWVYVDGLGRTGSSNVVKSNKSRFVGVFYWTWHMDNNQNGPFNVNNIVKANKDRIHDTQWWKNNYDAGSYWWNESIYGYYMENDDYVLRKQAELLSDAGVDFVVFDCTNGSLTWKNAYENLLKVWLEASKDGVKVPKVAFMLPFGYSNDSATSFMDIYNNLYDSNSSNYQKYHELLFTYNLKPLILIGQYEKASSEIKELLKNFEVRNNVPSYFSTGAQPNGSWGWLSTYPQAYYKKANGDPEQISVGVSMNANYVTNKLTAMNDENVMGRSYAKGDYTYSYKYRNQMITVGDSIVGNSALYSNTSFYGRNFQQQWDYALSIDPEIVFVTGWNEWIMGRFDEWQGVTNAFPDQFNDEYSRDIEPSKGELKDYYYYQLVDNIRKYKGVSSQTSQETPITINKISDWNNSNIISYDHYVGGKNRNIVGYGLTNPVTYVNNTFRNDIKTAKVSYDSSNVYFYVETVKNLTSSSDNKWMRLLIDTKNSVNNSSTDNWEEYEYIVNRQFAGENTMILEKSVGGWNFTKVGEIKYVVDENVLQLVIPRSYLELTDENILFNFKWCDNNLENGDIMSVYTDGDSAPGGRFAFHFEGRSMYKVENSSYTFNFNNNFKVDDSNGYIEYTGDKYLISSFLNNINVNGNVTLIILDNLGKNKDNNSLLCTGDKLVIYLDDKKNCEYIISVKGDSNGDGRVSLLDLSQVRKHIAGYIDLDTGMIYQKEGIYFHAIDINNDNRVSLVDLGGIRKIIVNGWN